MRRRRLFVLAVILVAGVLPAAAQESTATFLALRDRDSRVAAVGDRLAVGAVALCPLLAWRPGFEIQHVTQYGAAGAAAARAAFQFGDYPSVLSIVPGGPADRAGLRADDWLLSADGVALGPVRSDGPAGFRRDAPIRGPDHCGVRRRPGNASRQTKRSRAGDRRRGPARMPFALSAGPGARPDARADGEFVQLSSALVDLATTDDELAGSLAHELAHNQLRHRLRLNESGLQRGLLEQFGRNARLRRHTEEEADRLSVYLMAQAGFDPAAAPRMLDKLLRRIAPILGDALHPGRAARMAAMEEELARIARLRAGGQAIRPAFDITRLGPIPDGRPPR